MSGKLVITSDRALADFNLTVAHYVAEASAPIAQAFSDAFEEAMLHISRLPGSGSPRIGLDLEYPGLRSWPISGFPYVAVYIERDDHIDLGRVLHTARNIPESLADDFAD